MVTLLLHAGGWDEFLLMAGAVLLAFLIIKLTTRGNDGDSDDAPTSP